MKPNRNSYVRLIVLVGILTASVGSVRADEDQSESIADAVEGVKLDGVFQSIAVSEVKVQPEEWATYTVESAVRHGDEVQRGDTLISFKTSEYDKAVETAEIELELAKLALQDAVLQFESAKKLLPLEIKAAEDEDREATQSLKEFLTYGKERQLKSIEQSLLSSRNNLMYQEEELKQLEKMYKADDLTEETEEIILIRTRNTVAQARYNLEVAKDRRRQSLEIELPQQEDALQTAVKKAALALEKTRETLPRKLEQQEIELKKQKIAVQEQEKKLQRLISDKETLRVVAPQSGIVYYGPIQRGKISDSAAIAEMLRPGSVAKAATVLMSVVDSERLVIRVGVAEDKINRVSVDAACEVEPMAFPDKTLSGRVKSVSRIPISDGTFDCTIEVELAELKGRLFPGMKATCRIKS